MKFLKISKKKIILTIFLLAVLLGLAIFIKYRFGNILPVVLPPKWDLPTTIEKQEVGEPVEIPIKLASSYKIGVFAKSLPGARDLEFSPGGTLLVSLKSAGRVVALPDKNNDGKVDAAKNILTGLGGPHGLDFYGGKLFVAETRKVSRYSWDEARLEATFEKELFPLPYNGGHSTRSLTINKDGRMFVTLGSSCNVCIEKSEFLASVIVSDVEGTNPRLFAKGLRNSVFITLNPKTNELWGTEMGRDNLGDNLPPEEINIIRDGGNYGWPICYDNKIHDTQFDKNSYIQNPCTDTVAPTFKMQAHSAPLGLAFINSPQFPNSWQGDLLVSFHGSWNRSVPTGYKVVHLDVEGNTVKSQEDFLTGFLQGSQAAGRPVDLIFDKHGSLYLSDDKAGAVYKISKK